MGWPARLGAWAIAASGTLTAGGAWAEAPAHREERIPMPLGMRARHIAPAADTAFEVAAIAMANFARDGKNVSALGLFALGRGASETTGSLVLRYAQGFVIGPGEAPAKGLSLRLGLDGVLDRGMALRVSELALPLAQLGYVHGASAVMFDAGVEAAPVLLGSLDLSQRERELGFGAKGGAYAGVLFLRIGVSAQLMADHLIASTAEGGSADWGRALACVNVVYVDLCAEGFASRFVPSGGGALTAGYAGGVLGFSLPQLGRLMRY